MSDFVNSLHRGLLILKAFTPSHPMLRLQDLVNKTGLPKTTVLRLMRTLISLNYVQFNASSRQYFLGPQTLSLGFTVLTSMDLANTARPYMEELSAVSQQNLALGILDGTEVVCVERFKKRSLVNIDLHVGARMNLYRSAIGRAILAYLPEDRYKELLKKILSDPNASDFTGTNGELLSGAMEEVRQKGYSLNDNELIPGVLAIGAPIFNFQREVEGAISIAVIRGIIGKQELIHKYVPMLVKTTKKISSARGYNPEN
jgi:DNA-binding IclR family transcriptional regulator